MNLQLVYRYILSLSKNENMFYEKKTMTTTTTTTTTTGQKKKKKSKEKKIPDGESRTEEHQRAT